MGYIHVQIEISQLSKKVGQACGDHVISFRNPLATYVVLADGIGSGIKANVYANMIASRLKKLLDNDVALREAFGAVVTTMHQSRSNDMPYAVFTVVRILNNGEATVLAYEMPESIFIGRHSATVLKRRNFTRGREVISETNLFLEPGEGLLLYSDGITLAGIGERTKLGWSSNEICRYVNDRLVAGEDRYRLHNAIMKNAHFLWGEKCGDDCTVVGVFCRLGREVVVLTGPPEDMKDDGKVVRDFIKSKGEKVICGASTAQMVARVLKKELKFNPEDKSLIAPPGYSIEGIELATEGAVTLNQVYNILDEDSDLFEPDSSVTRLHKALTQADKLVFILGRGQNKGHADIAFRQKGILPRKRILELIAERLVARGHLVEIKEV